MPVGRRFGRRRVDEAAFVARIQAIARPLEHPGDLNPLLEQIGDARFVLLGEASHGTADFYTWRAAISKRLIREKGFSFIAVEGDWPDCYRINRYVKGYPNAGTSARAVLENFQRWPTWLWANFEIVELAEWLRRYNRNLPDEQKVGFYGLDVYSLWESIAEVIAFLEHVDPLAAQQAKRAYACFEPYREDIDEYAVTTALVPKSCEDETVAVLAELRRKAPQYEADGREAFFNAEQNALVARDAERYYRTMIRGGSTAWNIRDIHMTETLERLMQFHGPAARCIVWAHNTHIGDARATDLATEGMVNVGQLVRERFGQAGVVLVGFGTYEGTVIAAADWDAPMEELPVPRAIGGSHDELLHRAGDQNKLLLFQDIDRTDALLEPRGQRAIGVVYDPARERGNYVPTVLPRRYDALLFIDQTRALHPLPLRGSDEGEEPETYPWAV